MRLLTLAILMIAVAGLVFVGWTSAKAVDVGQQTSLNDDDGNGHGLQNQSQGQIKNQTDGHDKNNTKDKNETEVESNETNDTQLETGNGKNGNGISEQVHQIIEARKNGSITVPQGMLVRIIAHNHSLSVENATVILNETLTVNLTINGKHKSLKFELDNDTMNITDENVTVTTNETLVLENDSLFVGGKKILIMPSEVPGKIKTNTIKSAVLHVPSGDPLYSINATRKAKVLWLFDTDMDVELDLNAVNGTITNEKRPWWSFLAGVQE